MKLSVAIVLGLILGAAVGQTMPVTAQYSGWYDANGNHDRSNSNYMVGFQDSSPFVELRDFFVFDISSVTRNIVSARLSISNPGVNGINGNVYTVRQVSTPISTLITGGTGLRSVFADLGEGTTYGMNTASSVNPFLVDVNSAGVAALNNMRGRGQIAFGGRLSGSGQSAQSIFRFTSTSSTVQLVLTLDNSPTPPPPTPPPPTPPTPPPPPPRQGTMTFGVSGAVTAFSFSTSQACRDFAVSLIANTTCEADSSGCFTSSNEVVLSQSCSFSTAVIAEVRALWNIYVGRNAPRPSCMRLGNICFDSSMGNVTMGHVNEQLCLNDYLNLSVNNARVSEHCRTSFSIGVGSLGGPNTLSVINSLMTLAYNSFRVSNA